MGRPRRLSPAPTCMRSRRYGFREREGGLSTVWGRELGQRLRVIAGGIRGLDLGVCEGEVRMKLMEL